MTPWTALLLTTFILFVQGLATAYITVISTKGKLHDARRKWWKQLTKRGWLIVVSSFIILFLTIAQSWVGNAKEDYAAAKQSIQDSIDREETIRKISCAAELTSENLNNSLTQALKKQGYELDFTKNELIKLRDSAKTTIINAQVKDPIIEIYNNDISLVREKLDSTIFKITVTANEEAVRNLTLFHLVHVDYTIGIDNLWTGKNIVKTMGEDDAFTTDIPIPTQTRSFKSIIISFYGTCQGTYLNSKLFKIEPIIYEFSPVTKKFIRFAGGKLQSHIDQYRKLGYDL